MAMFAGFVTSTSIRHRYCIAPSVIVVAWPWTLVCRAGESEIDNGPPGPKGDGIRDSEIFQRLGACRRHDRWQATA
jgi:hypothetical protein